MGLFDDDQQQGGENDFMLEEYQRNQAEIEKQTHALSEQKLRLIKTQGAEQWDPTPLAPGGAPKHKKGIYDGFSQVARAISGN